MTPHRDAGIDRRGRRFWIVLSLLTSPVLLTIELVIRAGNKLLRP